MRGEEVYPKGLELLARGQLNLAAVASHTFSLEEAPTAFAMQEDYDSGVVKAVIDPRLR
jgi:L-iditol 2-dehydrogenase